MSNDNYLEQIEKGIGELSRNWKVESFVGELEKLKQNRSRVEEKYQILTDNLEYLRNCFGCLSTISEALAWIEEICARLHMKIEVNSEEDIEKEMERILVSIFCNVKTPKFSEALLSIVEYLHGSRYETV